MVAAELALSRGDRDRLCWAALLHDVGKLEISTAILNKPGALNATEWDRMRRHPADGARLCAPLLAWLGPPGRGIAEHHEKYDGSGYPNGLSGDGISLAGRVIAVVDAYETMTAARPYRKPVTTRAAREELVKCAASHFDPVIVRAFLAVSVPRLMWATGPLSLLTHLPYLRDLQLVGTQVASASVTSAVQVAGVTAVAVGTAIVPLTAADATPAALSTHNSVLLNSSSAAGDAETPSVRVSATAAAIAVTTGAATAKPTHGARRPSGAAGSPHQPKVAGGSHAGGDGSSPRSTSQVTQSPTVKQPKVKQPKVKQPNVAKVHEGQSKP